MYPEKKQIFRAIILTSLFFPTVLFGQTDPAPWIPPDQIMCHPENCIELPFSTEDLDSRVDDLMEEDAGMILVNLEKTPLPLGSDSLEDMRSFLREIAGRDGRLVYEPIKITERSFISYTMLPLAKDIVLVSVDIFNRIYNYFSYMETKNYHAKVVYNPADQNRVLYIYFVHRKYGDICTSLYSDCDSMEFFDDPAFDLELSRRLKESETSGRPVKISFRSSQAYLPSTELTVNSIVNTGSSFRVYKWFLAAKEVETLPEVTEKFIPLSVAVTLIDMGLKLYDLTKELIMYEPATKRTLRVHYEGASKGGSIRNMVFLPLESSE